MQSKEDKTTQLRQDIINELRSGLSDAEIICSMQLHGDNEAVEKAYMHLYGLCNLIVSSLEQEIKVEMGR